MKRPSRSVSSIIGRLALVALAQVVLILLMVALLPGFRIELRAEFAWRVLVAAVVIGTVNLSIGPLVLALQLPLNILTAGVPLLVVNFGLLLLASLFVPGFDILQIDDVWAGAAFMAVGNTVLTAFITLDDDYSYLQFALGTARRLGRKAQRMAKGPQQRERGMVLLEIDGLSYERMQKAIDTGLMPSVHELVKKNSHCLSFYDCGLPSQTSSCQAGILFGNNSAIPAFRWYDKRLRRMLVSNHLEDAAVINDFHSNGKGLLRGGSSINNLMNGDAARTLLTLSTLAGVSKIQTERATDLFNSFWLNPYTFARAIALSIVDLVREVVQSLRQMVLNEQPRINRLYGGYPFLRVITNVFLRDLATYAVMQEIIRGTPIIYTTFVGYDEVAHHAGPDTSDAMRTLLSYDRQVRHVLQTIDQLAPMDYDLFILSDHGQTIGATFRQRYGTTLSELIDTLTVPDVSVSEMKTQEAGQSFVKALLSELNLANNTLEEKKNTRIRRAAMQATMKTLGGMDEMPPSASVEQSEIVVCASGCLAHVYFSTLNQDKVSLDAIETAHPNLIQSLVQHAGIGFLVGYDDDGNVLMLGKNGARNLTTGAVSGNDPLAPFDKPDFRVEQILRLAQFDNAGDLILNSTLYEDGSVAAFEELVGSHGGLGGQQTHAFILHPCNTGFVTDKVSNSADVYELLENWKNTQ